MIPTLSPGAINVSPQTLDDAIRMASDHEFGGLEFSPKSVLDHGLGSAKVTFEISRVSPIVFGLPVDWRGAEDRWLNDVEELPRLAAAAQALGCTRTATWVMPCSNDREKEENLEFHVTRFTPVAKVLADYGISLGLEFIGPKTLRDSQKYPFIWTMEDMLDLGTEIGPNVGLLLDSFHWYTSGGTLEALRKVAPERIVYVHINDAREGRSPEEQIDGERDLPGNTGVIDLKGFLGTLKEAGYDGPVAVEPFLLSLKDLADDDARLALVRSSIRKTLH